MVPLLQCTLVVIILLLPHTSDAVWKPPQAGFIKFNVDAGWSGSGHVSRSHDGELMCAATHLEDRRFDPIVAEVLDLGWCMSTQQLHVDSVVFESDSLILHNALSSEVCPSAIEPVMSERKVLDNFFPCF